MGIKKRVSCESVQRTEYQIPVPSRLKDHPDTQFVITYELKTRLKGAEQERHERIAIAYDPHTHLDWTERLFEHPKQRSLENAIAIMIEDGTITAQNGELIPLPELDVRELNDRLIKEIRKIRQLGIHHLLEKYVTGYGHSCAPLRA